MEKATVTRCKFRCNMVEKNTDGEVFGARFEAVVDGSEENKQFFKYTPSGQLTLGYTNPQVKFEQGKEYYLDITPAE